MADLFSYYLRSFCSKFPRGSRADLRFAEKLRLLGLMDLNVTYTSVKDY